MTQTPTSEAEELVPEFFPELPDWLSTDVKEAAEDYARTAELETTVNREPRTIAAAAIYIAATVLNEKVAQKRVANATGLSPDTVRVAYKEIVQQDGIRVDRA